MKLSPVLLTSFLSLIAKVYVALSGLALSVVIARLYSAPEAGEFFLAFSVVTIAAVLTRVGLDNPVLRRVAVENAPTDFLYRSIKSALIVNLLLTLPVLAIYLVMPDWIKAVPLPYLAAVFPFAASVLISQGLFGISRVISATLLFGGLAPTFFVVQVLLLNKQLPLSVMFSLAWWLTFLIGLVFAGRYRIMKMGSGLLSRIEIRDAIPFAAAAAVTVIIQWLPHVMLGFFGLQAELAFFTAAERASILISFVLIAVNSVVAPRFARAHAESDWQTMAKTAHLVSRIALLAALPVFTVYVLFPELVMSIFGEEYVDYADILVIVSLGQLVNVACGSVFIILSMTGEQVFIYRLMFLSFILGAALNYILISLFGVYGSAIAYSIVLAFQNIFGIQYIRRKFKFWVVG